MEEIAFVQLNMYRAHVAAVELNKVIGRVPAVCLITEPYTAYEKVAMVPSNHTALPTTALATRPRAAIYIPKHIPHVFLETLSHADAAVALISTKRGKLLVASIYMDSNKAVVQPWMSKLAEFAQSKGYPTLFGLDSNAHSQLYGPTTNARGKQFEEFILQFNFKVENRGELPTYHQFCRNGSVNTCIDVTLSKGLVPLHDWKVHAETFNGSDHKTITWTLPLNMDPKPMIRPWKKAKWDVFTAKINEHRFDEVPQNFTTRKIDKFLDRIYHVIEEALDEACPKRQAKASPLENKWYGNDQRYLYNRTKRRYRSYLKHKSAGKRKAFLTARKFYGRSCRKAKRNSWRKFVEGTPDEANILKTDNTLIEPGADTIRRLAEVHFPAAQEGTTTLQHDNTNKISTEEIRSKFEKWISPELVRKALIKFKPNKAAGPDELKPNRFPTFPRQHHFRSHSALSSMHCLGSYSTKMEGHQGNLSS